MYLSPVSVVINGFYPKTGACEGAEHLLPQLAALALVINNFPLTPCFVHRVDTLYAEIVKSSIEYRRTLADATALGLLLRGLFSQRLYKTVKSTEVQSTCSTEQN